MTQLFELKTIQSEDDLPKEEGLYVVQLTSWNKNERSVISYDGSDKDRMGWLKNVQAYFSPVSVEKETVYVPLFSDSHQATHLSQSIYDDEEFCTYKTEVLIVKQ